MERGSVRFEAVSRRFRVSADRSLTFKDALVRGHRAKEQEIWALRDVSFAVDAGDAVGLVGRNGSGKSTLLSLTAGIIRPTGGTVGVGGAVGSLLELGAGFHPDFSGRENVLLTGSVYGLKRRYILEQMDEIVSFAELEQFIDLPVRTYSSGMTMRLGFSIATHVQADILLLDEVFAVGDEAFQRKCFGRIAEFRGRGGTIVFVSHDASAVERLCERALLLHDGRLVEDGSARRVLERYHTLLSEEDPAMDGSATAELFRVEDVQLQDLEGRSRRQLLGGEPVLVRIDISRSERAEGDARVTLELRERSGALVATSCYPATGPGTLVFELASLPLAGGFYRFDVLLSDPQGGQVYHRWSAAAEFLVYCEEDAPGVLRLDGRWRNENGQRALSPDEFPDMPRMA